jgi:hypothetical protein
LSVVDQDKHRSTISPFDSNDPNYFWITRNVDFTQWTSAETQRALLLSAPHGYGAKEICQHMIVLAKEKTSQTNSSVLFFFCSSAAKSQSSTALIHTLLHQVVRSSDPGMANSIAAAFLSSLVGGHFQKHPLDFRANDPLVDTVLKILKAPFSDLVEALAEAIKKSGIQELSMIVDGLQENIVCLLFEVIRETTPKWEVLLTSQHKFGQLPDGMRYIEYDKERQGLHVCHSPA